MISQLKILLELTKIKITSFVTVTTFLGYVLASGELSIKMIFPLLGTLFLACGSAVFNHFQERNVDSLMERTKHRPIPSGRISPINSIKIALILSACGSLILIIGAGLLPFALGILALIWYNLIYTPLKKRNPLAVIPGSLIGSIPPMIGWVSGGGNLFDSQILIVAFFFFIWQIPHFWLLMLFFDSDYRKAGFPTLSQLFSREQISRITFIWMIALATTCIGLPLFGIVNSNLINIGLILTAFWLIWKAVRILKISSPPSAAADYVVTGENYNLIYAFKGINIFALMVVILLSIDNLMLK